VTDEVTQGRRPIPEDWQEGWAKGVCQAVWRDHWHLSVNDEERECGSFALLSQKAMLALGQYAKPVERFCEGYSSRTHCRCDRCPACRTYNQLMSTVVWLEQRYTEFFAERGTFEVRRGDLNFDEVLPCGIRLRVGLHSSRLEVPGYGVPDFG
jgi:hypothetical protein